MGDLPKSLQKFLLSQKKDVKKKVATFVPEPENITENKTYEPVFPDITEDEIDREGLIGLLDLIQTGFNNSCLAQISGLFTPDGVWKSHPHDPRRHFTTPEEIEDKWKNELDGKNVTMKYFPDSIIFVPEKNSACVEWILTFEDVKNRIKELRAHSTKTDINWTRHLMSSSNSTEASDKKSSPEDDQKRSGSRKRRNGGRNNGKRRRDRRSGNRNGSNNGRHNGRRGRNNGNNHRNNGNNHRNNGRKNRNGGKQKKNNNRLPWTCSTCGTKNKTEVKKCKKCQKPFQIGKDLTEEERAKQREQILQNTTYHEEYETSMSPIEQTIIPEHKQQTEEQDQTQMIISEQHDEDHAEIVMHPEEDSEQDDEYSEEK